MRTASEVGICLHGTIVSLEYLNVLLGNAPADQCAEQPSACRAGDSALNPAEQRRGQRPTIISCSTGV
jgi:hypothetical protein